MRSLYFSWPQISLCITCFILACVTTTSFAAPDKIPAAIQNHPLTPVEISQLLGWHMSPSVNGLCSGFYQDTILPILSQNAPDLKESNTYISADQSSLSQHGLSVLQGNVVINQVNRQLRADHATLIRNPKTGEITTVHLRGSVRIYEPGGVLTGDRATLQLQKHTGTIFNAWYRIAMATNQKSLIMQETATPGLKHFRLPGLSAHGYASSITQIKPGVYRLRHATLSTCAPGAHQWQLRGSTVYLDKNTGLGSAYNARLDVHSIPILYTPYVQFPITHARKTGFLFPNIGNSSKSGFNFYWPFYWNIAPNYDATITPDYLSRRGLLMIGQFRYLTTKSSGKISGAIINHDNAFSSFKNQMAEKFLNNASGISRLNGASNTRYELGWQNKTVFTPNWVGRINYNRVSDDYYLQDFSPNINTPSHNQLPEQASLSYDNTHWTVTGNVQSYQTLHPVNESPVGNPYQLMPQLTANAIYPNEWGDLTDTLLTQYTFFDQAKNPGVALKPPTGQRLYVEPAAELPLDFASGFIHPKIALSATQYQIYRQTPGDVSTPNRVLPIFDINSGLYFERNFSFSHHNYHQLLEPQLFYLYVPYESQDDIPVFDSGIQQYTFAQLFNWNRFSGYDRISNANQLTAALSTQINSLATGQKKIHAGIGEILFFANRRVTLCRTPGCVDPNSTVGAISPKALISPLVGFLNYYLNTATSLRSSAAWDPDEHHLVNANFSFNYFPSLRKVFSVGYSYIQNGTNVLLDGRTGLPSPYQTITDLNLFNSSIAWPIFHQWTGLASWNYNISEHHSQSYLYGLSYDRCCWAVRVVSGTIYNELNQNNNPIYNHVFYLEFLLKGLGSLGNQDPSSLLLSTIPGYGNEFSNRLGG